MGRVSVALLVAEEPQHGVELLVAAHRALGHTVEVRHLATYTPVVRPDGEPALRLGADVGHSRASALWGLTVQEALARAGGRLVNEVAAQRAGRDKWVCTQLLREAGVPVLPTVLAAPGTTAAALVALLDGDDLVLKPLAGHSGAGVVRRRGAAAIDEELATAARAGGMLLAQPYADDAGRTDLRVVVVGGRVVACYERRAPDGDFRTNSGLPGAGLAACTPDAATERLAVRAAAACGLEIAGVDILHTAIGGPPHGRAVLEINTNCGLVVGLPTLTGNSMAHEMAAYVGSRAEA
ncbi:hypothetical protein IHE55_01445 [Streptomyces pactum]|uniref:ATP-grasp domain-containing protein n=1 Tax=Streptomyces pactum TaxID=68249 RepID=A0ABS0NED8_9ACTN|nr:hypothetical protein [Streptomyces pactum]MBH5333537.1 hypothetical protein [Streptomyces pactum]